MLCAPDPDSDSDTDSDSRLNPESSYMFYMVNKAAVTFSLQSSAFSLYNS